MKITTAIMNCQIVLETGIIWDGTLLLAGDKIAAYGPMAKTEIPEGAEVIDAGGKYVGPGLVDLHVHARDPGFPEKEDLFTCAAAARAGGFSDIAVMPNTSPVCDTPELVRYILQKSADFDVCVHPISAITVGEKSEQLVDMEAMADAGAMAFSDDGHPVKDDDLMREALIRAKKIGKPVLAHSEDERLSAGG